MRILIIGATGLIGTAVTRCLVAAGHKVAGLARSDPNIAAITALGATPLRVDLADPASLRATLLNADATICTAAIPVQDDEYSLVDRILTNYKGTGKSFIFTSGSGVLGQRSWGEWSEDSFAEDDEFIPSKYILKRRQTELRTRAATQDNVRAMVIRPPAVWGATSHPILGLFADSLKKTGQVCYIGRGLNLYSYVHVDDLAELYLRAIEKGSAGALYHAVAGEVNNRTLAEALAVVRGVSTHSVNADEAMAIWDKFAVLVVLSTCSRTRSPRARGELGWRPQQTDLVQAVLDGTLYGRA